MSAQTVKTLDRRNPVLGHLLFISTISHSTFFLTTRSTLPCGRRPWYPPVVTFSFHKAAWHLKNRPRPANRRTDPRIRSIVRKVESRKFFISVLITALLVGCGSESGTTAGPGRGTSTMARSNRSTPITGAACSYPCSIPPRETGSLSTGAMGIPSGRKRSPVTTDGRPAPSTTAISAPPHTAKVHLSSRIRKPGTWSGRSRLGPAFVARRSSRAGSWWWEQRPLSSLCVSVQGSSWSQTGAAIRSSPDTRRKPSNFPKKRRFHGRNHRYSTVCDRGKFVDNVSHRPEPRESTRRFHAQAAPSRRLGAI